MEQFIMIKTLVLYWTVRYLFNYSALSFGNFFADANVLSVFFVISKHIISFFKFWFGFLIYLKNYGAVRNTLS